MAKLTAEKRSALQSARAKNRKAVAILGNAGAEFGLKVPKNIVAKMVAIEEWFEGQLAAKTAAPKATPKATPKANTDGGAMATDEAENSGADLAWAARLAELTA